MKQLIAVFVAGKAGEGLFFVVKEGDNFSGADITGTLIDGTISQGDKHAILEASIRVPPNTLLVQGSKSDKNGLEYKINQSIPENFLDKDFIPITTPLGKVNIRFRLLRDT